MNASIGKRDQLSVFLLFASIFALLLAMAAFFTIAVLGVITWYIDGSAAGGMALVIAAGFFVMGVCTIPGIYYGYQGMQGRIEERKENPLEGWMAVILIFPFALGLGYLALKYVVSDV